MTTPYAVPLPSDLRPEQVVGALTADEQPSVLWGRWFGGGVAVFVHPRQVVPADAASDLFEVIGARPAGSAAPAGIGGGWITVLGYSPGHSWALYYDAVLRWQPGTGWTYESVDDRAADDRLAWWTDRLCQPPSAAPSYAVGPFSSRHSPAATRDRHLAGVESAISRIHAGDFYQLNLCTRLHADFAGSPAALFADLATATAPDYAALVTGPGHTVVSGSPELFLAEHDGVVETAPIKGTAPRGTESDSPALRASAKDAAENVMIVDLMRNDLSRVCRPGTVQVSDLLGVRPHPGVWHLVSTVRGRLRPEVSTADLLRATFPPGSVTGAPKIAACAGIEALEPEPRGAYTGAIGLVTPTFGTELAVTIRTLEITRGHVELGVGGGITVDSVPVREWSECLDKAAAVVTATGSRLDPALRPDPPPVPAGLRDGGLLETMLAVGPRVLRLAAHLDRLDRSCREVFGRAAPEDLADRIRVELAGRLPGARSRVRVVVRSAATGSLAARVTVTEAPPRLGSSALALADRPVWSWRHKWAGREAFATAEAATAPQLPYFLTPPDGTGRRHVAETSRGNLFCRGADGIWRTPPADDHLLPGVTRREVGDVFGDLGLPWAIERFTADDLYAADAAFWTSSLSGVVEVTAVDGHPLGRVGAVLNDLLDRLGLLA